MLVGLSDIKNGAVKAPFLYKLILFNKELT